MDTEVQKELIAGLPVKVVAGGYYDRIQVDRKTIAYAIQLKRSNAIKLDFAARTVPAKFQTKAFINKGDRMTFRVDGKNVQKGRELLEWLASC